MTVIDLPAFKTQSRDRLDHGAEYIKTMHLPKVISLPSEFNFYLKKFKRVYRIELSHSTKRWVLTTDEGRWGWDQRGDYVRTLCSAIGHRLHGDFLNALFIAQRLYPNEAAFFCPELMEFKPNDPEFDNWFANLGVKS